MSVSKILKHLRLFYVFNFCEYEQQSELDDLLIERIENKSLPIFEVPDEWLWHTLSSYALEVSVGKTYIVASSSRHYVIKFDESKTHIDSRVDAYHKRERLVLTRYTSEKLSEYLDASTKAFKQAKREAARKEQILKLNLTKGN